MQKTERYKRSKKAIGLAYNNGFAKGSVNKIKVVKRIMYCRNSFALLKVKLQRLELRYKSTNFGKNRKSLDKYPIRVYCFCKQYTLMGYC